MPVLAAVVPLAQRQLLLAGRGMVLLDIDEPRDLGAAAARVAVERRQLGRLGRAAAGVAAARAPGAAGGCAQPSVQAAVEVARGGDDAGNHVDGGLDEGVNHGPARGVPRGVAEERRGEEDGEAQHAGDDAHGGGEKRQHQPDLFRHGHLQLEENRPRDDEHDDVGDEARDAVELVKEHDVAAGAVVDVDGLRPEVAKGAADGKGEDEGDDALQDDDGAEEDDEAAVRGDLEDLVVEEEGGELGEHDGRGVGELEDLGELQPGLKGGDGDGGDVVAHAADLGLD